MNRQHAASIVFEIAEYRYSNIVRGSILLLAAAVAALACGWSYVTEHSVRFNSFKTGRGFYRLPPLPIMYDAKTGKELSVNEVENDWENESEAESDPADQSLPNADETWEKARTAVEQENLGSAESLLKKYLELAGSPEESDQHARRNAAYDMLDALTALAEGSKISAVKEYLDARYTFPDTPTIENPLDKNLQDNWDYLWAAALYSQKENAKALEAFQTHALKYPKSEKNEAVMYMIGKITMESSYSFEKTECGILGKGQWGKEIDPATIESPDKCQDENWSSAVKEFQQMMRKYPKGRYFNDVRGWLAFLYKRGGERANALAEYYRLLGDPADRNARIEAKKSLQIIGHEYDDATLDKVEELIADDANAALAYSYHRIYNHAVDLTYDEFSSWCCYDETDKWQQEQDEKKRVADVSEAGRHELRRVAVFATAMIKRYPQARVSGSFVLRVAEAQLELQNYSDAYRLALRAIALGIKGDAMSEALWVKGSCEHQRKDLKAARATFNQLITEFPNGRIAEGTRRLLAMTAEDQGDLETALDQYLALDYKYDAAYFIDVLLPTDRLAKFVADRPNIPQHDQLLYALGVRYMRDKRWDEARAALRKVNAKPDPPSEDDGYETNDRPSFAKLPDWDWKAKAGIKISWVMQDLKTIDVLEHLEKAVDVAVGDEAKAEAMYQLASFQFDADDLLFYNPAAWEGNRYELLFQLEQGGGMRLPDESQIIFEYSQSHETYARAIPIYLEIVDRFPQTKAARDALFSAAVADERLSNLNPYWREIYGRGLFAGSQMVKFSDLDRLYPNFRWPRARNGWEASTRTVDGGPGWAPKPKPLPKLTRTQKFERRVKYVADKFQIFVKPRLDSFGTRIEALANGYISILYTCLAWLFGIVAMLGAAYVVLLCVHFQVPLLAAARRLSGPDMPTEQLQLEAPPDSDSRIEKVIGELTS